MSVSYVFRPATLDDLPVIYRMQNIPFRDTVYANHLPKYAYFEEAARRSLRADQEEYYIFEADGNPDGFVQYLKGANSWNIIVWGKWLNTLIYLGLKTAYDDLGCPNVTSAIRENNTRVVKAYEKFRIRYTGREMVAYQLGGAFGYLTVANLIYYEMTREEFEERREFLRSQSMEVRIMPPAPRPEKPAAPPAEPSEPVPPSE